MRVQKGSREREKVRNVHHLNGCRKKDVRQVCPNRYVPDIHPGRCGQPCGQCVWWREWQVVVGIGGKGG